MEIRTDDGDVIQGVELKESLASRIRGLMFREAGRVLLSFPRPGLHGIWMMGMRFPIDVAFIDEDQTVIAVKRDVQPVSFDPSTWRTYRSPKLCRYVLEVEAGLLSEKGVSSGTELVFED